MGLGDRRTVELGAYDRDRLFGHPLIVISGNLKARPDLHELRDDDPCD